MNANVKNKGFTLIELMIVVAIICILGSLAMGAYQRLHGGTNIQGNSNVVVSAQVSPEIRCIEGTKVLISNDGSRQLLDTDGKPQACKE